MKLTMPCNGVVVVVVAEADLDDILVSHSADLSASEVAAAFGVNEVDNSSRLALLEQAKLWLTKAAKENDMVAVYALGYLELTTATTTAATGVGVHADDVAAAAAATAVASAAAAAVSGK